MEVPQIKRRRDVSGPLGQSETMHQRHRQYNHFFVDEGPDLQGEEETPTDTKESTTVSSFQCSVDGIVAAPDPTKVLPAQDLPSEKFSSDLKGQSVLVPNPNTRMICSYHSGLSDTEFFEMESAKARAHRALAASVSLVQYADENWVYCPTHFYDDGKRQKQDDSDEETDESDDERSGFGVDWDEVCSGCGSTDWYAFFKVALDEAEETFHPRTWSCIKCQLPSRVRYMRLAITLGERLLGTDEFRCEYGWKFDPAVEVLLNEAEQAIKKLNEKGIFVLSDI